ncbi:MAG: glycerol-3-phosphate 1-O-acyltransferase PlsY [Bacteroidia bacterium]|nr:glycerol-3-phosphate 1-O-acyltransferase PlsY [Bacteroidia bacterium]
MIDYLQVILICAAYFIGSIPTAVWLGKAVAGIDVREHGSGNAGATNTIRVLGLKVGIPVLVIDVLKGWVAVKLSLLSDFVPGGDAFVNFKIALAVAAIVGHIFPIFVGFRGGKGVATLLGAVIAIVPLAAAIAVVIFILVLFSSKYVSLSSMMAGISFPFSVIFLLKSQTPSLIIFSIFVAVLLVLTHKKNIQRLLKKQEARFDPFKAKSAK